MLRTFFTILSNQSVTVMFFFGSIIDHWVGNRKLVPQSLIHVSYRKFFYSRVKTIIRLFNHLGNNFYSILENNLLNKSLLNQFNVSPRGRFKNIKISLYPLYWNRSIRTEPLCYWTKLYPFKCKILKITHWDIKYVYVMLLPYWIYTRDETFRYTFLLNEKKKTTFSLRLFHCKTTTNVHQVWFFFIGKFSLYCYTAEWSVILS